MEYKCPIYESSQYPCGREAIHLVQGTAICGYHTLRMALQVNEQGFIAATPIKATQA